MTAVAFNDVSSSARPALGNALYAMVIKERPDLQGRPCFFPKQGKSGCTLLFDNEAFKCPLNERQVSQFEQERRVLSVLAGQGLLVPAVTTIGKSGHFFGMQRMRGIEFGAALLRHLSDEQRHQVAGDIADLVAGVADTFADSANQDLLKLEKRFTARRATIERILEWLEMEAALGVGTMGVLREVLSNYIKTLDQKPEIVMHDDLHSGNILFDVFEKRISGFLDFGMMARGAPENAFSLLHATYPPAFVREVCDAYNAKGGYQIDFEDTQKAHICHGLTMLSCALHEKNEARFKAVLTSVNAVLCELTARQVSSASPQLSKLAP